MAAASALVAAPGLRNNAPQRAFQERRRNPRRRNPGTGRCPVKWLSFAGSVAVLSLAVLAAAIPLERGSARERELAERARRLTGGDPEEGRVAVARLGCTACHSVPGVRGANATVGPPLDRMGSRTFIAGVLPNTPENLILWIKWPQGFLPKSAMPNLDASDADGRNIAAYLYTLE
jgi:cytochrome c